MKQLNEEHKQGGDNTQSHYQQSEYEDKSQGYQHHQQDSQEYQHDDGQQQQQPVQKKSHEDSKRVGEVSSQYDSDQKYPIQPSIRPQHSRTEFPESKQKYRFQEQNNSNFGTEWESDRGHN